MIKTSWTLGAKLFYKLTHPVVVAVYHERIVACGYEILTYGNILHTPESFHYLKLCRLTDFDISTTQLLPYQLVTGVTVFFYFSLKLNNLDLYRMF